MFLLKKHAFEKTRGPNFYKTHKGIFKKYCRVEI